MKSFAKFISLIFHPIFMPIYMAFIVVEMNPTTFVDLHGKAYNLKLGMLTMLMVGFPLISIAIMKGLGFIESFKMQGTKERFIPMIAVATFYLWAFTMYKPTSQMQYASEPLLANMILGCVLGVFMAFFFNSFYKISFHTIAAGGFVAMVMNIMPYSTFNLTPFLILSILLAGLIATARLYLKEHTSKEVYMGLLA
ncbi:MAG: hypothetical protein ACPGR5_07295, partial [Chitinophagales bacterium]